jgi:hypothetical protein
MKATTREEDSVSCFVRPSGCIDNTHRRRCRDVLSVAASRARVRLFGARSPHDRRRVTGTRRTKQGADARGGAKDYIVNGKMTGGFAFIAYPEKYGDTAIATFIINQDGVLFDKDLGNTTTETATAATEFNPDKTWTVVPK